MHKYGLLRERLVAEGIVSAAELLPARAAPLEEIHAVHDAGYVQGFLDAHPRPPGDPAHRLPLVEAMVLRSLGSVGSTLGAVDAAMEDGIAGSLAGGTHHAYRDFGSATASSTISPSRRRLLDRGAVERVLVFDVDVHQGDGTAAIFEDDDRVFTCSVHGSKNFPSRKMTSDLDVPLPDGTGDEEYLAAMSAALEESWSAHGRRRALQGRGGRARGGGYLGRLSLTREGVLERDRVALGRFRGGLAGGADPRRRLRQPDRGVGGGLRGTYRVAAGSALDDDPVDLARREVTDDGGRGAGAAPRPSRASHRREATWTRGEDAAQ